jgi:hypothetical protein
MSGIETEAELIERLWQRINISKCRQRHKSDAGDIQYLERLMLCLKDSLSRRAATQK